MKYLTLAFLLSLSLHSYSQFPWENQGLTLHELLYLYRSSPAKSDKLLYNRDFTSRGFEFMGTTMFYREIEEFRDTLMLTKPLFMMYTTDNYEGATRVLNTLSEHFVRKEVQGKEDNRSVAYGYKYLYYNIVAVNKRGVWQIIITQEIYFPFEAFYNFCFPTK